MKTSEKRVFGRRRSRIHAFIEMRGRRRVACIIENFSEGGALLVYDDMEVLPSKFRLNAEVLDFASCCEIVQRQCGAVGVKFISDDLEKSTKTIWTIDDIMSGRVARETGKVPSDIHLT